MHAKILPLRNPGETINNRYQVAQIIGKGATAQVFVVADPEKSGHLIALKYLKLPPEFKTALDNFKSEFDTMTHLNHPNIAKVYDFEWDEEIEYYFFTSEMIDGFDFVSSTKNLDIEKIEELLVQSLRALEYLHGHGIHHFDIKPHNILVQDATGPSPSIKVIDFGLASTHPPDKLVGTPSYIAPEMIRGKKPDGRADLYSLGVLAYFALTHVNPYKGATQDETLQNHLETVPSKPVDINPAIPEYLSSIIMKLLEMEPDHRYATASDVIRDINFRSTRFHAIETPTTLLHYVPWEGPFAGRTDQIEAYKRWLKSAEESGGKAFWICGNLGTGKSRFLEECKNVAQLLNFNTLMGNEISYKFLNKIQKAKPKSVILIDDLDKSIELGKPENMSLLQDGLKKLPAVVTSSDDQGAQKKIKHFLETAGIGEIQKIDLANFTIKELREYICTLTGLTDAPNWLVGSLFQFTGGNPLYITETLKLMVTSGLLFDQAGRWKKSTMEDLGVDLSHLEIPPSVGRRLEERLSRLGDAERDVLSLLSACRYHATEEILSGIMSRDVSQELKRLAEDRIIKLNPQSEKYFFGDLIAKRAVYLWLPAEKRRNLHDTIIKYLRSVGTAENAMAHHIQRAGDDQAARKLLLKEINEQRGGIIPTTAINLFLERFGDSIDDDVLDVYLLRAKKQIALRNLKEVHSIYEDLLDRIPVTAAAPGMHYKLHIALGLLYKRERKLEEAIANFKEAKRLAKMMDDPSAALVAENHLASIDVMMGNHDYAIEKYTDAREKAKQLESKYRDKITNNDLGYAYFYKGDYDKAADVLKDDVKFFRRIGEKSQLCRALYSLGEAYRHLRKFDKAELNFKEIIEVAKEIRDVNSLYRAYNGMGNVLSDDGNFSDSIGYFERALDLAVHMSDYDAAAAGMINTAIISSNLGDVKKSFDTFQTTLAFLERKDFPVTMREPLLCRTQLEVGELYRLQKKFDQASTHLEKAAKLAAKPESSFLMFWVVLTEAKMYADRGEKDQAGELMKKAKKLANSADKKKLYEEAKEYVE